MALEQAGPQAVANDGGHPAQVGNRQPTGPAGLEPLPAQRFGIEQPREHHEGQHGHQAAPDHKGHRRILARHRLNPPRHDVGQGPHGRSAQRQQQAGDGRRAAAHGAGTGIVVAKAGQAERRQHHARLQRPAGAFTQQHKTKQRGKKHLRLQQHRGQRRRHADFQGDEQKAELAHALEQAIQHHPFPWHLRRPDEQRQRQPGKQEAGGAELKRREVAQREFHRHKVDAPDQHHHQGGRQVTAA